MKRIVLTLGFLILGFSITAQAEMIELFSESGIRVSYEKTGDESQVKAFQQNILPEVKSILNTISSDLGVNENSTHVWLYFYSPETYHKKFPNTVASRIPAFYKSDGVHARADNDVNHALKKTLRHELTHLVIDRNYGTVPAWVNEGLAMYEERLITVDPAPNNIDYNTIYVAKQDGNFMPLDQLLGQSVFGRSHGTVAAGLAYTTAYVAVYELKEKAGLPAIRNYIQAVGKGKDPQEAFQSEFNMSYKEFNDHLLKVSDQKKG